MNVEVELEDQIQSSYNQNEFYSPFIKVHCMGD